MRVGSAPAPRRTFWEEPQTARLIGSKSKPHPRLKLGIYAGIGTALFVPASLLAGLATPFMLVTSNSGNVSRMWHRVGNLVDYRDMQQRVQARPYL
jgi:hypothetical protein